LEVGHWRNASQPWQATGSQSFAHWHVIGPGVAAFVSVTVIMSEEGQLNTSVASVADFWATRSLAVNAQSCWSKQYKA